MPGRSKSRAKRPSESPNSLLIAENAVLKMQNKELAKSIGESKMQCARLLKESSDLQRQIFARDCENSKMKECFKRVESSARSAMESLILASNHITQIVQSSMYFLQPPSNDYYSTPVKSKLNMSVTSENTQNLSANKTRVVKPMISGHTILSPMINLRRVPREQMEHLMSTLNHDEATDNDDVPDDESQASIDSNLGRQNQERGGNENESSESSSSSRLSDNMELEQDHPDHGSWLDTVQEEDENVSHLNSPLQLHHGRLRSNSFKNIKVSMEPVKRRYNNLDGSVSNDSPKPCVKSNGSLHYSSTNDSSSDSESNSTDFSTDSNKGDLDDSAVSSENSKNIMYNNTTISDSIPLRNNSARKSIDMGDDFNNSDAIPEDTNLKNLSTVVNSNLDVSDYQNNLSIISSQSPVSKGNLQEHVVKEFSTESVPKTPSNVNTMLTNSYDPLEGSSSLLDYLQRTGNESKTLHSLDMGNPSKRTNTSTPYSPIKRNTRRKKSKPSDSYESFITTPDVSKVSPPSKVTRRKIKSENHYKSPHLFHCNSDEANLHKVRKCSVRVCQLPCNKLSITCRQKSEVPTPTWNQEQSTSRDDNNTPNSISNECRPTSSNIKEAEPLVTPKLQKTSPRKRGRRNVKIPNMKEPSLIKKMRRSR